MAIKTFEHILILAKDIEITKSFYVDILGLQVTEKNSDFIYLRVMEERGHHWVILKKSDMPSCNVLGYIVFVEDQLDKAQHYFET